MIEHPIRKLDVRTYSSPVHGCIAQFGDGRAFPIIFRAPTVIDVLEKAELFRQEVLEKHEATYIARKKAGEAAKARAAAKKARK